MKQYDYLIVGSGLTGAVFAHEASQRGKRCLIVEKRPHTGGNVYTATIEDIHVHRYGAHIFHTSDKTIWDYINRFAKFNNFINSPIANYRGNMYNLPFNMNTFSQMWGVSTPAEAAAIIDRQKAEITGEPRNLEEQAISLVGRDIFEKLVKGYTEKQWGKPCSELPASIIKRLPVRFTYDNNYYDDTYQGIPVNGYTYIIEQMTAGCDIRFDCDFLRERRDLTALADKIVYTGMIDAYFGNVYGPLEYRSLRFEDEMLHTPDYQSAAVVNYTDADTPFTRIIEHKHFLSGIQPHTIITREYPASWDPGMEAYYPVDDDANRALLCRYQKLAAKEPSVIFCGRLAEYKYYDMDDAIASALAAAEKEL